MLARAIAAFILILPLLAPGQTLNLHDDVQTVATLTNTTATLSGKAELHVTGTGDPLTGSTIHLNSEDAWFFLPNIVPSQAVSTFLSRVRVSGVPAVVDSNVRVAQYASGTVIIPHAADFAPMEVFVGRGFTGTAKRLRPHVEYGNVTLGELQGAISSFRLKRGYIATIAQNENGTGISRNYVAQDGDLQVSALPAGLDNRVRFVRIFPWRWASKKGIGGNIASGLKVGWYYNWNLDQNSSRDLEYVPIRQTRWWPGLDQNWRSRGATHLLGYNEPDRPDQANMSVADAISGWPDLLATGLRLGAPAVSDGGLSWLYSFIDQADAAGLRVDYVPVHYYRCFGNANDPVGAANQLYSFLKGIHDRVKRPLWVTEWNNGANWTSCADPTFAQQQATVSEILKMLDDAPFVERHAIFNWVEDVRRVKWDDGSLTAAGTAYRDKLSPISYQQEVPDSGLAPAAHFPFSGDLRDALLNGHDGMAVGAPRLTPGKYGQALTLDGATDYVQVSAGLGDSTDFTFAGWVKWGGGAGWQRIFDFGDGTSRFLFLSPRTSGGNLRFAINTGSGEQQLSAPPLTPGVWTHVAVTISGNTGKLFVNGALAATNTSMSQNPIDVRTRLNYIGKSQFPADPHFNGQLDNLRFLPTALSDAQIAAIAQNSAPIFTALPLPAADAAVTQRYTGSLATSVTGGSGALAFSKVSGPGWLVVSPNGGLSGVPRATDSGPNRFMVQVRDAAGGLDAAALEIDVRPLGGLRARYAFDWDARAAVGELDAVASGSPAFTAGRIGNAIDLDGADDFLTFPAGLANSREVTIASWIWWDGGANWQRVFDFGNGTGEYLFLTPKSGANTLRFTIKNSGGEQTLNAPPLPTGQWVHVAVSLGNGMGRLFVNGVAVDSQPVSIAPSNFGPAANYLGKSQFAADPLFNGKVDEFLVFARALSPVEVLGLVTAQAPAFAVDRVTAPPAEAGERYEHTIAGTVVEPNTGNALTFSKVLGPEWLTVSPDGRISGVPGLADIGANEFTVRVTDPNLMADDALLSITVSGSGPLAQYRFNRSLANDRGGVSAVSLSPAQYTDGLLDSAILLDGVDDHLRLPAGLFAGITDVTLAVRVRWDGGAAWQRIFDFGRDTSGYFVLTPSSGNSTVQFAITNSGSGNSQRIEGSAPLPVGVWVHVAVTLIGNTGMLYVDGAPVASGAVTIDPATIAPTLNYLGRSQFASDPYFNGAIDDFQVFQKGLSVAEIAALALPPPAVPVPDSSYSGWVKSFALPPGEASAAADPDKDGLPNGWEYLLGGNPLLAGTEAVPEPKVRPAAELGLPGDKSYLTLQLRVRRYRLGIVLIPEAASSVAALAAAGAANHAHQIGTPVPDGDFEVLTYYYDVPIEDTETGVGVLRVKMSAE